MTEESTSSVEAAVPLPTPVRDRAVGLAADTLGALAATEIPTRLRAVARFAPARRAKLGSGPLAAALDTDAAFLARVAELARAREPDLCAELESGRVPAAVDPVDLAALAYVLRAPGWPDRALAAGQAIEAAARAGRGSEQEVVRLREQLEQQRAEGRTALDEQRRLTAEAKTEAASLRRTVADARRAVAASEAQVRAAVDESSAVAADAERRMTVAESEGRRLRDRLAEVERALEAAKRAARQGRSVEEVRLRLLLDTVVDAASGLRRELALPPLVLGDRPADGVAEALGEPASVTGTEAARTRALLPDDPAVLDQLLALPQVHLVVDGYNVTKTGFGTLPLEAQRARLVTGLAALAAQTSAEVTCVFDGATVDQPAPISQPRGVRVVFSPAGITADSVIRSLVRAEPSGRPVIVVSSDREVVDGVVAAGARAVASAALVRRLARG